MKEGKTNKQTKSTALLRGSESMRRIYMTVKLKKEEDKGEEIIGII